MTLTVYVPGLGTHRYRQRGRVVTCRWAGRRERIWFGSADEATEALRTLKRLLGEQGARS